MQKLPLGTPETNIVQVIKYHGYKYVRGTKYHGYKEHKF